MSNCPQYYYTQSTEESVRVKFWNSFKDWLSMAGSGSTDTLVPIDALVNKTHFNLKSLPSWEDIWADNKPVRSASQWGPCKGHQEGMLGYLSLPGGGWKVHQEGSSERFCLNGGDGRFCGLEGMDGLESGVKRSILGREKSV